ncbi:MAG: SulP family inorganic anion transporter, partial [Nocardioides sp.]|nr:SulP family inorganic anion transporter [Nocardioides sp.]
MSTVRRLTALLPGRGDLAAMRLQPGRDVLAGSMVALVALPLALGFGVSSGLGAAAGITTAIVAGALAAVFGGSNLQVSGPTGAMTVVLVPIVAEFGADGVLVVGLLAGLMLLALAASGAGRFIRYLPVPVVEGFTIGIAVIIALQQLPSALGVDVHAERVLQLAWRACVAWAESPHWEAPVLAVAVVVFMLGLTRVRLLPSALAAVVLATVGAAVLGLDVSTVGELPSGLSAPSLPTIPFGQLDALLLPAIAVAALAALESLLSATVADAMSVDQRHDPDRELFGQGIANLV